MGKIINIKFQDLITEIKFSIMSVEINSNCLNVNIIDLLFPSDFSFS